MTRQRDQRGAVTAETAVVLPLLAALALGLAWLVSLGISQARAVDAAREVARVVARGDTNGEAVSWGHRIAPDGARFRIRQGRDTVVVTVTAEVRGPGGILGFLPGFPIRAEAVAATEDARR